MVISIFAIVLELFFVDKKPDPKPKGFVVASMWFNFVLMILFSIQTLWPICILCYELCKELTLGVWSDMKFLDRVINIASNPTSKLPARLGTRKKTQTARFLQVARRVEMVRRNLMRSVERRRAARARAIGGPELKRQRDSMGSFVSGVAMDAVHTAGNVAHLTEKALKRGFSSVQGVAADTMHAEHLDEMTSGSMHVASSALRATHLDRMAAGAMATGKRLWQQATDVSLADEKRKEEPEQLADQLREEGEARQLKPDRGMQDAPARAEVSKVLDGSCGHFAGVPEKLSPQLEEALNGKQSSVYDQGVAAPACTPIPIVAHHMGSIDTNTIASDSSSTLAKRRVDEMQTFMDGVEPPYKTRL